MKSRHVRTGWQNRNIYLLLPFSECRKEGRPFINLQPIRRTSTVFGLILLKGIIIDTCTIQSESGNRTTIEKAYRTTVPYHTIPSQRLLPGWPCLVTTTLLAPNVACAQVTSAVRAKAERNRPPEVEERVRRGVPRAAMASEVHAPRPNEPCPLLGRWLKVDFADM